MSGPQPPTPLEGHCSTIYDDTLYVLSPTAFQSLPLKKNATWSAETQGVPVTGPACVQAGGGDLASFYVIGGTSDNAGFSGLQAYNFASKAWTTVSTPVNVLSSRTNHSAAYLQDSSTILVYAGSQPDAPSYLSSQTFLIHLTPPYNVESYVSQAQTAHQPILEPWNGTHAVMVGGNSWNTEVWLFDPAGGWNQFQTQLSGPIDPASRGLVIEGGDGSKVLQLIDFNVSPNNLTNIVLETAGGQPASVGQVVGGSSSSRRKRDLTLDNWPTYNNSDAPSAIRNDCAVATDPNGLLAISGGSNTEPVALFDQAKNSWVDTNSFFGTEDQQQPLQPTSTLPPVVSPTSSSTPSSATTTAASSGTGGGMSAHNRMLRTLGITLGVICGIAAIFILVLLYLRWRKIKRRRQEGYVDEKAERERMSFQDRGASFMKEAGVSAHELPTNPPTQYNGNNYSQTSLAIIAGKFGNGKRSSANHQPKSSYDSTAQLVKNKNGDMVEMQSIDTKSRPSATISRDPSVKTMHTYKTHQSTRSQNHLMPPLGNAFAEAEGQKQVPEPDDSVNRNRSSGWSKYFATSQPTGPTGLSHLPTAYTKPPSGDSATYTDPSDGRPRIPSAIVAPLDLDFTKGLDGQRLSKVATSSPSFNDSREDLAKRGAAEGQRGVIENASRPVSRYTTSSSHYGDRSTISSNMTADFFNNAGTSAPWPPESGVSFKDHVNSRPASSLYTASVAEARLPSRGKNSGFFPGAGASYRPSKKEGSARPSNEWSQPRKVEAVSTPRTLDSDTMDRDRDSTVTVFPRGVSSTYYANREKERIEAMPSASKMPMNEDMSWLNINQQ